MHATDSRARECLDFEGTLQFTASFLSRLFALTGFPGARRFTSATLRLAIEAAGFRIATFETIRGPFPVGFVDAVAV